MRKQIRGQTELLGFVMVVALISIAVIFIVAFLLRTSQTDVRADFIDKQLAINLNDAMLETSTTCRNIQVRDLLLDCGQDKILQCGGDNSCDFLREKVFSILLNTTIGEGGRNSSYTYRTCVQLTSDTRDCFNKNFEGVYQLHSFTNGDCSKSSVTPGIFPLPTRSGRVIYSVLNICR